MNLKHSFTEFSLAVWKKQPYTVNVNTSASSEFIKTLIDLGADVNAQISNDNVTPSIVAAYKAVNIL